MTDAPSASLAALLNPDRLTCVVDVGANPIDGEPPYKMLLQNRLCRVVGFEPQSNALAALNARKTDLETYLPYVLGDGGAGVLKLCRAPGMTSLLMPDPHMLSHFAGFPEWGTVVGEAPVTTHRLDDVAEITDFDFLKIDVQGSELTVMQNGRRKLANAIAVQAEVSFLPLYKDQACFGEIEIELRGLGFVPHALAAVNKRMILPMRLGGNPYAALNQIVEADVVYVRDFTRADNMSAEQLKHLAIVAHYCYGSFDLAGNCIHHLMARKSLPPDTLEKYLAELKKAAEQAPQRVTTGNVQK